MNTKHSLAKVYTTAATYICIHCKYILLISYVGHVLQLLKFTYIQISSNV